MGTAKIGKLLLSVLCLNLFVFVQAGYGAKKDAETYYNQGKKYLEDGNYDQAIPSFNWAIRLDPKMARAYNNRGVAYVGRGQLDEALADFNMAIKLQPKNAKYYHNRAIAYFEKGNLSKARQDVQKAQSLGLTINPEFLKKVQEPPPPATP